MGCHLFTLLQIKAEDAAKVTKGGRLAVARDPELRAAAAPVNSTEIDSESEEEEEIEVPYTYEVNRLPNSNILVFIMREQKC